MSIAISIHLFNSVFRRLTNDLLLVIMGTLVGILSLHQAINTCLGKWAFGSLTTLPMNLHCQTVSLVPPDLAFVQIKNKENEEIVLLSSPRPWRRRKCFAAAVATTILYVAK